MTSKQITIAAHNGEFHADDVCAVATILLNINDDSSSKIIRSRDEAVFSAADYVVDVGGVYDESKNRFDHHQKGGAGVRANGIPFASFGLVWKKFGPEICGSQKIADEVDRRLVAPIDATDNGVSVCGTRFDGVRAYDMSSVIGAMNPTWKEEGMNHDKLFFDAVTLAKKIIEREIVSVKDADIGEQFVIESYERSADKRVVILEKNYPWAILSKFPEPLYAVYPKENGWYVKTVRVDPNDFKNRKDLPEEWAGKRDSELAEVTGVSDAFFCHNKRFVAVAKSKGGAVELAKRAVDN